MEIGLVNSIEGLPQQNIITAEDLFNLVDTRLERPMPQQTLGAVGEPDPWTQYNRLLLEQTMTAHRTELQDIQERMSTATTFEEGRELEARHNTVRTQLQIAEADYMATTTAAWAIAPIYQSTNPQFPRPSDPVLLFHMKQNTHTIALNKLRDNYTSSTFSYDFNVPIWKQFLELKYAIRDYADSLRRQIVAKTAYQSTKRERDGQFLIDLFASSMTNREMSFILADNEKANETRTYMDYESALEEYKQQRRRFRLYKGRYGEKQADYNRRAAMIRQKPELFISINRQSIVETIMTWDNVWAADTYVDNGNNTLYVRVGLCNITMSESAQESYYDDPQDILLAPFYVTIKLTAVGNAIVSSTETQIRGLSRSNPGQMSYDLHPHQLSDSPCFGTFGQTLIDLANNGDIISYIGTLIAFYSQYNSQDSAGVAARIYHPAHLTLWGDQNEYKLNLCQGMRGYEKHLVLNEEKLDEALEAYKEYHEEETRRPPPELQEQDMCASCENESVGDNDVYYLTAYDSRVCEACWNEYYCEACERGNSDCECEPEEEERE